jgi:hypothetical protein
MLCLAASFASSAAAADGTAAISAATKSAEGFLIHEVQSPFQTGAAQIRILLPDRLDLERRHPVIYVLPVEAGNQSRYGDGLAEVWRNDLHNIHGTIFVAPTFSQIPWYADHPTDPGVRQESHLLEVVIPFVEKTYPAKAERSGRLLLGFSKSGWGAWSLLLRRPEMFERAAAWDAPLMMGEPGRYGSAEVFGTRDNFEEYRISKLLRENAAGLRKANRLSMTGFGNFQPHHERMHALLEELQIPHDHLAGPRRDHDWHSGWVAQTVEQLLADGDG